MALERILFPFLFPLLDDDDGGGGSGGGGDGAADADADGSDDGDGDDAGDDDGSNDPEKLREELRRHRNTETRAKRAEARIKKLEKEAQDRAKENQTDQEKAVDAAREEGRSAAAKEASKARRDDRLEVHATRLASRGVKVGEGDDAKTVKFADPEDALAAIQRRIANGDIDADELFSDEDKVQTDLLTTELADVLAKRPHLAAGGSAGNGHAGASDGGKGGPADNDLESLSPEDHAKRKYPSKS